MTDWMQEQIWEINGMDDDFKNEEDIKEEEEDGHKRDRDLPYL